MARIEDEGARDEEENGEDQDFEQSVDGAQVMAALQQLHGNSGLIGALQQKLDGLVGLRSGFLEELHPKVRARVRALEQLQESHDELHDAFVKERRALEAKYAALYEPLYKSRSEIVTGAKEAECEDEELRKEIEAHEEAAPAGVPEFWLIALKNHEEIAAMITERDEGALKHLVNVTTTRLEGEDEDGDEMCGFKIDFHFEPNDYFEDEVLTKTYHMDDEDEDVLRYIEASEINWKAGKNLTVKVLRKKPKPGAKNKKPITKTEPAESFFQFFYPPEVPDDEEQENMTEDDAEQLQEAMEQDYEIGSMIATNLIPDAVNWFTGEAFAEDDDEFDDEDEDDEDDDDDEDDEDEDDEDEDDEDDGEQEFVAGKKSFTAPSPLDAGGKPGAAGEQPPECKQQ
ncbi:Nucleosome assembly protein (NAP) [Ostreococcus tauri]|uniref:Nucleosome assembly protein (NAP) n=1 Tax=Ostreococcus tauri TaxID=70448 RepID=A0A096P826_OSTTA|nr:Nucleosome assembly protein (NAP) [Ostreococcus tauri]CEG00079.1 Nucleosome assembly protein (NAP) [Ostreococcus tauri]|eukprot:XP_022840188.1 Nucleosome assembly protein (NAP) [Ostreococcus tauri]